MQYSMLRLFLTEREILPILIASGDAPTHSRSEYLEEVFSQAISFVGRNIRYQYAYVGRLENIFLGRIGRQKTEKIVEGPEMKFAENRGDFWHAANILIDISDNPDGQKIAFQEEINIGKPLTVAEYLVQKINDTFIESRWQIAVNAITEARDFWKIVDKNKGHITELDITFVAPNIFGGHDKTTEALKKLSKENKMQETTVKLSNSDGELNPDSQDIRDSIEYISKGGGSAKLKTGKETVYSSEENAVSETVEEDLRVPLEEESKPFWPALIRRLFK